MAAEVAGLEKDMFIISKITKAKIDLIESKINEKFEIVNFRLFDTQVNGAIVETCTATVNGVAYSDLNTEAKVNAGLDIIRTLSNEYKVSAPIFIDNRESVTEILDVDAQIINLVVNANHKKLNVEITKK